MRSCRICGCTEADPCIAPVDGQPCGWSEIDETLCDACDAAAGMIAEWMAVQSAAGRELKPGVERLLRHAAEIAPLIAPAEEPPRIVVCDDAAASAYLRARVAGV